jgi:ActD protein
MPNERGLLAMFSDPARAAHAVRELRSRGAHDLRVSMPAAFPEILEALGRPPSRLGRVTLSAAATGTLAGFALCIGTALAWPLVTGGKAIVSMPPFVIVAFELSVLVGAVVNLAALTVFAWRGRRQRAIPVEIPFSVDRIGIFVADLGFEQLLRDGGAVEVKRVA